MTLAAIAMVVRIVSPLAAVDPRATLALGLLTGGAFGNLASMLTGPEGVADFLAVQLGDSATVVMNVADLLLWGGALLLVPVVVRLVSAVRAERSARS
ncbi:MAG: signal peptidase II [Gemmatimonadaceae bacterium]|nr:signal peptidase II [Gemmatimonadaceae bacterium]